MIVYEIVRHKQPEVLAVIYPAPGPGGWPGEFVEEEVPAGYEYIDRLMREIPRKG